MTYGKNILVKKKISLFIIKKKEERERVKDENESWKKTSRGYEYFPCIARIFYKNSQW